MKKVLIVYSSVSGSTREIAGILKKVLEVSGHETDCMEVSAVNDIPGYDCLIIGSPMRFGGFTHDVKRFIKSNKLLLIEKDIFFFQTCLYIIKGAMDAEFDIPVFIDPSLAMQTIEPSDMDFMDKTHKVSSYMNLLKKLAPWIKPGGVAYFNGRLELGKLNIFHRIFMKIITKITTKEKEGDFVNPEAAKAWAKEIARVMG